MPAELKKRLGVARDIILAHVAYFAQNLGKVESQWKYDDTRVTAADLALSRSISTALMKHFPDDDLVSEEDLPPDGAPPRALRQRFCWVLDPIDGTNNYAKGCTSCGILLGLLEDGMPVYGWTYEHLNKQLVEGGPGFPLLVDGVRFAPPPQPATFDRHEFVTVHFPLTPSQLAALAPLLQRNTGRSFGSAAIHLVGNALGIFSGSVTLRGKVWDIAAGHAQLAAVGRQMVFLEHNPFPFRQLTSHPADLLNLAGTNKFLEYALPLFRNVTRDAA